MQQTAVSTMRAIVVDSGRGSRPNGSVEKLIGAAPHTFRHFDRNSVNKWNEGK